MTRPRRNKNVVNKLRERADIVSAVAEANRAVMQRVRSLDRDCEHLSFREHLPFWGYLDLTEISAKRQLLSGLIPLIIGETHQPRRLRLPRRWRIEDQAAKLAEEFGVDREQVESMYWRLFPEYID